MEPAKPPLSARALRQVIRGIDAYLRRRLQITEFEGGPDALVRIALNHAEREIVLSDGTRLRPDDRVLELHFWNEHLLTLPQGGATLRWAATTRRQIVRSLQHLAEHLRTAPDLAEVKALLIRPAFAGRNLARNLSWIVVRHGFESAPDERRQAARSDAQGWLDSLWVWLLTWAYNPRSLNGRRFRRSRQEFWFSRARFMALYGEPARAARPEEPPARRWIGAQPRAAAPSATPPPAPRPSSLRGAHWRSRP